MSPSVRLGDGRFELVVDGAVVGVAEFHDRDGRWVFTHTEIEPGHEGEGLGSMLVQGSLDHVYDRAGKVVPLCPFVARWIERHDDYADIVDRELLAELS